MPSMKGKERVYWRVKKAWRVENRKVELNNETLNNKQTVDGIQESS